ncbi:hypothetical protein B0A49_10600, partial [Cryomyces minteri]
MNGGMNDCLSDLTESSPKLCRPYLSARSFATPYFQPYYDGYLASYIDQARPYVDQLNEQVYTPARSFTKYSYDKYAAPRVAEAQKYGQAQWEKTVRPQLEAANAKIRDRYDTSLAPQVNKAYAAVDPYYSTAKNTLVHSYDAYLLPAYTFSTPYVQQAYTVGHRFTVDTGLPYAQWAGSSSLSFLNRTLWLRLRVLYGENVEPQLMRISARLGRYKDGKKLEAAVASMESSSEVIPTPTFSSVASVVSSIASTITDSSKITVTSSSASATPSEASEVDVEAKVADDLRNWQEKFAKAANKGSEDLRERVQDITDRQIKSQVHGVGQAHVAQLEETSSTAIDNVKSKITSVIKSLPTDASDEDVASAEEKVSTYIRGAGKAIKAKAQNLRSWKQSYDEETFSLVKAASNSTLEVIDNIRDLGLQEIGQRWALMEGVAYKDWSKYHNLKKTFDEWRDEVEDVAMKHEGLSKAKKEGSQMEEKGMAVAEEAAKQLAKLKDVARWKVQARDTSDDFSVRRFPAAAAKAAQQVRDKMSDASAAVVGTSQGKMESVVSAGSSYATGAASIVSASLVGTETGSVASAASNLSEKLVGTEQPVMESVASVAKEKVQENLSKASQSVIGTEPGVGEKAATRISEAIIGSQQHATESVVSPMSSKMADMSLKASRSLGPKAASLLSAAKYKKDQASASIIGTPAPLHESVPSQASSSWDSVSSAVSEALPGQETPSNLAERASSKIWGGAMAQAVPQASQIILEEDLVDKDTVDNDVTYSERLQSMVSRVGDRASELTMVISDALAKPTSTQGSVESVTSLASEQYERAMSAASSILYGTEQGTGESMSSVASERYAQAVTAASHAIYGTPAAVGASLASQ